MAPSDPPLEARRQQRWHRESALAILAAATGGAAVTLQVVGLATDRRLLESGLAATLWVLAMLLTVGWLVTSLERRLVRHLDRIEGSSYREGYAAGYVDAAQARKNPPYERTQLRPVR